MQSMASSAKTAEITPVGSKKGSKRKKNEKVHNFSVHDKGDCQAAWLFAHWGPFGHQRRAWPDGADRPHFHMHTGKIGQFFEVWVFPATQVGLCVDGPYKTVTTRDLQNTPGTPAMHFPLLASGSQSALYAVHPPYSLDQSPPSCRRYPWARSERRSLSW